MLWQALVLAPCAKLLGFSGRHTLESAQMEKLALLPSIRLPQNQQLYTEPSFHLAEDFLWPPTPYGNHSDVFQTLEQMPIALALVHRRAL